MDHYIIRIGVPRVPETHRGLGHRVVETVPCDGITKRAIDACTLAIVALATKSTFTESGLQEKPDNVYGIARIRHGLNYIALCTGDVHRGAVGHCVCTRCGKRHASGCRLWLPPVATAAREQATRMRRLWLE